MHVLDWPSPNHDARPTGGIVDMLILHYTGMISGEAALARLTAPEAKVSAHYVIEEDGAIWHLVPEDRRAWHAGLSFWAGRSDINAHSIGIELVNPGHEWGYRPFPEPQMAALEALAQEIMTRHPIAARFVLGHSDVAPQRKEDPGELFDWARLARAGIGLWPDFATAPRDIPKDAAAAQRLLAEIGYEVPRPGALDAVARAVVTAFQRHFHPAHCDGVLDLETRRRIAVVAAAVEGDRGGP
jgi:N-acetylmuramoyl-L-alanine amidase